MPVTLKDMTAANRARVSAQLEKRFRFNDGVMTLSAWIERQPAIIKTEGDGMIDYSRTRFNRMDGREQAAYMARLSSRRYYYINSVQVPKLVFDAIA